MKRNLLPAAAILLLSIAAIQLFGLIAKRLYDSRAPQWQEVPTYTYLPPYATLSPYDRHFREAADSTAQHPQQQSAETVKSVLNLFKKKI